MVTFAVLAAVTGTWLIVGAFAAPARMGAARRSTSAATDWLRQAGLADVAPREFVLAELVMCLGAASFAWICFGSLLPSVVAALFATTAPVALHRARRSASRSAAADSWPNILEELRLLTGAVGRSIPVGLFEAGQSAPNLTMRTAFASAQREWLLTTDFQRAIDVLKSQLGDPTADAVCETLLIAHDLGGNDLDRRLHALIDDRRIDLRYRHEALSRQSGVRFARWFVLAVPFGMALVGLGIGDGRSSFRTLGGQLAVVVGLVLTAGCWMWAGRIMHLPENPRVFD